MKKIYYNARVTRTGNDGRREETTYEGYKKITYKLKGGQLKVYLRSWSGSIITEEFENVETIRVIKYKK